MRIAVLHGPNLNRLGVRRPDKYGTTTLADITKHLDDKAAALGVEALHFQANAEHAIIDWIHERQHEFDGIVINPAGLTAAGYSLLDAVRDPGCPFAVVHISQYHAIDGRERDDIFAGTAAVYITGAGWRGYLYALEAIFHKITEATAHDRT